MCAVASDPLGAYLDTWTDEHEADVRLAQELLAKFTYKPGWVFEIDRRPELPVPVVLSIKFATLDSRSAWVSECRECRGFIGARTPVAGQFPIPHRLSRTADPEALFYSFLRNTIWFVERHESDEWFQVDGELMFDPHKNDWTAKK